jgi:hypothetical protein
MKMIAVMLRNLLFRTRLSGSRVLFAIGLVPLAAKLFPPLTGGVWTTGAGFKITATGLNSGSIVDDPAQIDLGEYGIWFGIKQTLGGATPLYGSTDRLPVIRVIVPGDMDVTVATAGDALTTVTLTAPDGNTTTTQGKVVGYTGPNLQANTTEGNQKTVSIQTEAPMS